MKEAYILPFAFNFIQWLKDNLFSPLIGFIAQIFVEIFIKFFTALINSLLVAFSMLLYSLYSAVLMLLDMFQTLFDLLSGTEMIHYTMADKGESGMGYLAEVFLRASSITNAFKNVWILGIVLCAIFVIAAVLRSIGNLEGNGESVNDVIKNALKAFTMFMVIQIVAFGTLALSNVVLSTMQKGLNYAIGEDSNVHMADAIFAVSAINAGKSDDPEENAKTILDQLTGDVQYHTDWSKVEGFYNREDKFWDVEDVTDNLIVSKIDFISGGICIWFVLKYMAGSVLVFIKRLINIAVLFIIAPFFVAVTPLDGGARFERWKEHFIGYCFSTLSVIVTVRIYIMLVPLFISSNLIYNGNDILAYLIRLYSVVILSMAFEKTGGVVNRIMADAEIGSSADGFAELQGMIGEIKDFAGAAKNKGGGK